MNIMRLGHSKTENLILKIESMEMNVFSNMGREVECQIKSVHLVKRKNIFMLYVSNIQYMSHIHTFIETEREREQDQRHNDLRE